MNIHGTLSNGTLRFLHISFVTLSLLFEPTVYGQLFVSTWPQGSLGEYTTSGETVNASLITSVTDPQCMVVVTPKPHVSEILYVNSNGTHPVPPYVDWSTAATSIQDAVDVALPGDEILVTNGIYQTGGRVMNDGTVPTFYTMNRVAVTKAVSVQSVNGSAATFIVGSPTLATTNAVRCVYLTNGAALVGFTLTNGATQISGSGGGIYCPSINAIVANCMIAGNSAYQGSGAYGATLTNCIIAGNSTDVPGTTGGGAYGSALLDCTLSENSANNGGGAYFATLGRCTIYSNSAVNLGGGESDCVLNDCTIAANSAGIGGGGYFGVFCNCVIANNSALNGGDGGGTHGAVLTNCTLTANSANLGGGASYGGLYNCNLIHNHGSEGGGAYGARLCGCTIATNSAAQGGGAYDSLLNACFVISNTASDGGGGAAGNSVLTNCLLATNSAYEGGGAADSMLNDCNLFGNSASFRGGGAYGYALNRCVLSGNSSYQGGGVNGSALTNCILTGNTASEGGGAWYGTLDNCVLKSNLAQSVLWAPDGIGGGAYISTLNNCEMMDNSAYFGGGAHSCTLNNCTVAKNSATLRGGGAYNSTLNNSIAYFNSASDHTGLNHYFCTLNYSCSTCDDGCATVTNDPLFINLANSDLRLQANSPCINAGLDSYVVTINDLAGNPRIAGGAVDIGAYEVQSPASEISYAWLLQYGLPTDGSADFADTDGDGIDNLHEWMNGTDPTNMLISLFDLQDDGQDELGISPPMSLENVTFTNGALALPLDLGHTALANIHGLSYTSFTASVDFKPTSFAYPNRCILSGGQSMRWLELDNDAKGRLVLKLNNWDVVYPLQKQVILRRWHRLACSVDIDAQKIVVFLDGEEIAKINLKNFQFNTIGSIYEDADKSFSFVSGGTGDGLCGYAKNLLVYSRALAPSELAVASGKPVFLRILNSRGLRENPIFSMGRTSQQDVYWLTDQQNQPIQMFHYPAGSPRGASSNGNVGFKLNEPFYLNQFTTSLIVHVILPDGVELQYPLEQGTVKTYGAFEIIDLN